MKYFLYRLYKDEESQYRLYEFDCPQNLNNKFEINIPQNVKKESIVELRSLRNQGLIPELLWINSDLPCDFYLIAVKNKNKYSSKILKGKENVLRGTLPNKYTGFVQGFLLVLYLILFGLFAYWFCFVFIDKFFH